MNTKTCLYCDTEFEPKRLNQKYCHPNHTYLAQKYEHISQAPSGQANCKFCSKEFNYKNLQQEFCSRTCIARKKKWGTLEAFQKRTSKLCKECGKNFTSVRANANGCSNKCRRKLHYRRTQYHKCPLCRKRQLLNKAKFVNQFPFCSALCMNSYRRAVANIKRRKPFLEAVDAFYETRWNLLWQVSKTKPNLRKLIKEIEAASQDKLEDYYASTLP